MTVRKTIKWCLVILLLAAVCVAGSLYWLWTRSDELLRSGMLAKLAEIAPEWEIDIGRARFDWNRRIHVYNLSVSAKHQREPIVTLPEVVISVDREKLAEQQEIVVQKVRLLNPQLNLNRDSSGKWNWQALPPLPKSDKSCPEWAVESATVRIRLDHGGGTAATTLVVPHTNLQLISSGMRRFLVKGETQLDRVGTLLISGEWDLNDGSWRIDGRMNELTAGNELVELAASASPKLRTQLVHVGDRLRNFGRITSQRLPGAHRTPASFASRERPANASQLPRQPAGSTPTGTNAVPDFGITGTFDINFRISQWQPDTVPEFKVLVDICQGQVANPALPFPLRDLTGKIYWDNRQLLIRNLAAKNGITRLALDAKVYQNGETTPGRFEVNISNLLLDRRLRDRLPDRWRKLYDPLNPSGRVDIGGTLHYDGEGGWTPEDFLLTAREGTVLHEQFPYPVQGVTGTIRQRGEQLDFLFGGRAGRRAVKLEGYVTKPKPGAEASFDIHVDRLPIDETLLAACNRETQDTLTSLNLKGTADVHLHLFRPQGPNRKFQRHIVVELQNSSLEFEGFPYPLSHLRGTATYTTASKTWTFRDLKARHGTTQLTGGGTFSKPDGPGRLELTIAAEDTQFDKPLEMALPERLQELWDDLSPTGRFNLLATIDWRPGQPAVVSLPRVEIFDAGLVIKAFPYPLENVHATLSYAGETVDVTSFSASHDDTKIRAIAFAELEPTGGWRIRIEKLFADDLVPDRLFRRALPPDVRDAMESLNPRGPVSLSGMLEFRGSGNPRDPITAAWDLETILGGGTVTAGVDLNEVHGSVTARGTLDSQQHLDMRGRLDLDSVVVLDHQLTQVRGPYRLIDQQLTVGSGEILKPKPRAVDLGERLTAKAISGTLTLDAAARLSGNPSYHLKLTMSRGRLEQYARRYLPGTNNVRGEMNGWIDLKGEGTSANQITGSGRLQIHPAALYELPIMAQIFKVLSFVPPDKTAFTYARADFTVAQNRFRFKAIDLVGDAISLRGRGTARFDGKLELNFYSTLARNQLPRLPILNVVLGEATTGWVGVKVRGNVEAPIAEVRAVPTLDDALKRFLGAFEARPQPGRPRFVIPPLGPPQIMPRLRTQPPRSNPRATSPRETHSPKEHR